MWELYWLTRVDGIVTLSLIVGIISIFIGVIIIAQWVMDDEIPDKLKRSLNICIITFIISLLLAVFIPQKQDMLLIYGLGPTIDYIQDNEKVKELPDKCVEALSKWVDSLNEDK